MHKPLLGEKLAVLVANGFNEKDMVEVQRAVQSLGVSMRIVSMDNGLVNSWNGAGWGLNFAADEVLSGALAADFSMLIVPGGSRSAEKLQLTAHTRRFINGFLDSGKPVVALAEAMALVEYAGKLAGKTVGGDEAQREVAEAAGAVWSGSAYAMDGNLMTGTSLEGADAEYVGAIKEFLVAQYSMDEAA